VVVCADVLEHIEEDDRVVAHLARALKPGGVLLVTSPSVPQPKHLSLVAWRERRIGFDPSDYGHVRAGYSEDRLRELLEGAGLEVESVRRTFGPAGTLMFDLFFVTGDSRPHPLVYLALFPLYMLLAAVDVFIPARSGAAVMGVARKTGRAPSAHATEGGSIRAETMV
jgi:SAM-dependent methyltransferase